MFGWRLNTSIVLLCFLTSSVSCVFKMKIDRHQQKTSQTIKKVHVIFMNHLDVGFSDGRDEDFGYASQVINRYQTDFFKKAVNLSRTLEKRGYAEKFVYTTHPWLVSLYLNCPDVKLLDIQIKCPSKYEQQDFVAAVQEGYIQWQAGPMNLQTDNLDVDVFTASLNISKQLDKLFSINRTHPTFSQRDVPGVTKAVIPTLMSNGIKALSVGVNRYSAPPDVPSPFVWKFKDSDPDGVLAFWNKGGYPNEPGPYPSQPGGLAKKYCTTTPLLDEALCFAFRQDNWGPPESVEEVLGYYEVWRLEFPKAEIVASSFDEFVKSLEKVKDRLPVVTSEIGDTWIQGIASDPRKTAAHRAFVRSYKYCLYSRQCDPDDVRIQNMLRWLVKLPEHTWGADDRLEHISWTNDELAKARKTKTFQETEDTWREQREFINLARYALGDHPLGGIVDQELEILNNSARNLTGYMPVDIKTQFDCPGGIKLQFGVDGSIIRLYDPFSQIEWASTTYKLGEFIYDTYTEQDFDDTARQYNYEVITPFQKPNMSENSTPEKKRWPVGIVLLYRKDDGMSCDFWLKQSMLDLETQSYYGAPASIWTHVVTDSTKKAVLFTLQLMNKVTTRLPESMSFGFEPKARPSNSWFVDKLGQEIDVCDVVNNGSQYIHGTGNGVTYKDPFGKGIRITAKDTPLVNIGTTSRQTSPFPVPLQPLTCSSVNSIAYNIYNNIWNVNYITYYPFEDEDENIIARYGIYFE